MLPLLLTATLAKTPIRVFPLDTVHGLELHGASLNSAIHKGKRCVELTELQDPNLGDLAVIKGLDFHNGTIEFDEAGLLTKTARPSSRSFVGIAFRVSDDGTGYENFYLRMTNGRSPEQELRNHAVQYCSLPNHPWNELRATKPFRYEAYTDLVLGAWTHVKISVEGTEAKFYVNRAAQPTLVVHDLLHGDSHGKIALFVAGHTRGFFRNLRVRPA